MSWQRISQQMKENFKPGELINKGISNPNYGQTIGACTQDQLSNYFNNVKDRPVI